MLKPDDQIFDKGLKGALIRAACDHNRGAGLTAGQKSGIAFAIRIDRRAHDKIAKARRPRDGKLGHAFGHRPANGDQTVAGQRQIALRRDDDAFHLWLQPLITRHDVDIGQKFRGELVKLQPQIARRHLTQAIINAGIDRIVRILVPGANTADQRLQIDRLEHDAPAVFAFRKGHL